MISSSPAAAPTIRFDLANLRASVLAERFRNAAPFPHVVIDDFALEDSVEQLCAAFEDEDARPLRDDIFEVLASDAPPGHPAFQAFLTAMQAPSMMSLVTEITSKQLTSVDGRAYAYQPGHYLLPHADHRDGLHRAVAYVFYVAAVDQLAGGQLELFDCRTEGQVITETRSAALIEPTPNRLVLFDVTKTSLHQVREVTSGIRLSITGWYYSS